MEEAKAIFPAASPFQLQAVADPAPFRIKQQQTPEDW